MKPFQKFLAILLFSLQVAFAFLNEEEGPVRLEIFDNKTGHTYGLAPDSTRVNILITDGFITNDTKILSYLSQRPCFLTHSTQRDVWTYAWFMWNAPKECHGIRSI